MAQIRKIVFFASKEDISGIIYFVYPRQATKDEIFDDLDARGFEPEGRGSGVDYDCSGKMCCSKAHVYDGRKHKIVSQRFYRDI